MPPAGRRRRLGDLLIEAQLIDETQLKAALNEQRKWGGRLGRTVVEMGFVTETAMSEVLAQQLELPMVDLDTVKLPQGTTAVLRLDLCERYGVFPLDRDLTARTVSIATSDPTNVEHLQALEFATNLKVLPTVCTASAIERAIRHYYFGENVEPVATIRPERLVVNETTYELDALMGEVAPEPPRPLPAPSAPAAAKAAAVSTAGEAALRQEIAVLREKVDALEELSASQVRAVRVLLELLIESGLVTRDEYLEKLHAPE